MNTDCTKFPNVSDWELTVNAARLTAKILSIQRSKDHHAKRAELSEMQSSLHAMKLEIKRRENESKRARWGAITPTAA